MNLLLIMTDQMHKYALGCVSPFVKTPHLDRLAQKGTLFTNAYSNNPICTPFRGLLYSGRYSKDNGVKNNSGALSPREICLADELDALGYETSFVGKLHLGGNGNKPVQKEKRAGHRHFLGYQCYNGFLDHLSFYDEDNQEHTYQGHRTDITTDLGIQRLRMLKDTGKPFLHTIFYQAPHYPVQPSPEYEALYDGVPFPFPEEYQEIDPYTPTFSPYSPRPFENCRDYQRYGNNMKLYWKLYYAMVTQIDANVGRILEELEQLGIADDTAVLFSSDHGDMQGSHGMKNKCLPYERSCGIPLIAYVPGMEHVAKVETPVTAVDYYPTCMELAGGESKKSLPGKSLLPLMRGHTKSHIDAYAENFSGDFQWAMLRHNQYKLVADRATGKPLLLFDLDADPQESQNLAGDNSYQDILQGLSRKLSEIMFS